MTDHAAIFTPQYKDASGPGSTVEFTAPYRAFLEGFILGTKAQTILDLGCGDMEVMGNVNLYGAQYRGVDVIEARIDANRVTYPNHGFFCCDFHGALVPSADLVLCKDVLQHWSTREILAWLDCLRGWLQRDRDVHGQLHSNHALLTNCNYGPRVNTDIETGGWRPLDLTKPPFSVGEVVFRWNNKDVVLVEKGLL